MWVVLAFKFAAHGDDVEQCFGLHGKETRDYVYKTDRHRSICYLF